MNSPFRIGHWCWLLAAYFFLPWRASGQTNEQIGLAFRNIRSDDIPHNGAMATEWIYAHRDRLKKAMLDELKNTDHQGRDALLNALFDTKGFDPDQGFCQLVVSRLNEGERYVGNRDLSVYAHWRAWDFIERHYPQFKPLLLNNLQSTNDMWCIWGTVTVLHKHGDLEAAEAGFSPHIWSVAAKNLADDNVEYNAGQAVRFYLIVGKPSLPHLQALTKSGDAQSRNFAAALTDAMGGSKRAYGYLGSEVAVDRSLFPGKEEPSWMAEEVQKWEDNAQKKYR